MGNRPRVQEGAWLMVPELLHRRLVYQGPEGFLERLLFFLLKPLGFVYGLLGVIRCSAYKSGILATHHAGVPVISIGNLAAGGTGKTPVVDYAVKYFLARGKRVAVVSRGYGGRIRSGVGVVCHGAGPLLSARECGDEPHLLARRNPEALILVARRRADGVRLAEKDLGAEIIILDDGFQHLGVARDFDIVLLDARLPLGNGRVLPAGLLREFPSALQRADLFLLTRHISGSKWQQPFPRPVLTCRHLLGKEAVALTGEVLSLEELAGKKGIAFAGIADPNDFFSSLRDRGLALAATVPLPDHVDYTPAIIRSMLASCPRADYFVTTEKDAVKLRAEYFSLPCYQIPLVLDFSQPDALEKALDRF